MSSENIFSRDQHFLTEKSRWKSLSGNFLLLSEFFVTPKSLQLLKVAPYSFNSMYTRKKMKN